ncbi:heterokaryon incompatibility protein 6, or allele [Fusarium flagelliforme]|uniref:Heterokaryon incompatibility protein 6, or allele n=1 Tax=Fusarium flagelliforme TaxID=2675880 RepID=A0A395MDM3_9HYPO|nr:heterokaryon incompatibility protein 6, or allele [Fusarium flagelliforme]
MAEHVDQEVMESRSNDAKVYKQLDPTRQEIRLLTLHPATEESDQICCSLSHAALNPADGSAPPVYEALSYVWGEPVFSEPILLNEQKFLITPSLKYALSYLRYRTKPRVLWVDAVCINQSDMEERNQQVALMRDIYSRCERDIAWIDPMIGRSFKTSHLVDPAVRPEVEEAIKEGMEVMHNITAKNPKTLKQLQNTHETDGYLLEYSTQGHLRSVFVTPTIWKRLWVMQELSLAPRLTLVCKDAELDWDYLSALLKDEPYFDAFHMYRSHSDNHPLWGEIFVTVKLIEDQRRLFREAGQVHSGLMDVLTRFREMESTDPRDKIFGLLGLVTEDHGIHIDYTKSVGELYQETTMALINLAGNLDILCQNPFEGVAGHKALQQAEQSMPSWVAEFDAKHRYCVAPIFAQREIFNAGLKHCKTPCPLGNGKGTLALRGTILGTIKPILQDPSQEYLAKGIMDLYFDQEIASTASEHIYAPSFNGKTVSSGETCIRAFWRTLVKDCTIPPRMRRLREKEIEILDVTNQERLREEEINLFSFRIASDKYDSHSVYSYNLGERFDYGELDDGSHTTEVRNDTIMGEFMFTMTENGLFVLGRRHVREGDVVVVLDGGKVPMILRKAEDKAVEEESEDLYRVVCAAYVHGFMDGEAEVGVEEGWLKKQDILLV